MIQTGVNGLIYKKRGNNLVFEINDDDLDAEKNKLNNDLNNDKYVQKNKQAIK